MAKDIFDRYRELARKAEVNLGSKDSIEWFRQRIRKDSPIRDHKRVSQYLKTTSRVTPGAMVTYIYDPKLKGKLPFYDNFPLIIFLDVAEGGWYGANLHYLPPSLRAELLIDINHRRKPLQQIAKMLESDPRTRPCLKRYLSKQLRSPMKVIPKDEWEIAIQLPFESFTVSQREVWRDSKRKI